MGSLGLINGFDLALNGFVFFGLNRVKNGFVRQKRHFHHQGTKTQRGMVNDETRMTNDDAREKDSLLTSKEG